MKRFAAHSMNTCNCIFGSMVACWTQDQAASAHAVAEDENVDGMVCDPLNELICAGHLHEV